MNLQKPFQGVHPISQKFGENLNNFYAQQGLKGHEAIDFAMPIGTPLLACCDGTVTVVSTDPQRGEGVTFSSKDTFLYNGQTCYFAITYWHMMDGGIKVKVGDKITTGQVIGLSGNTGRTTGPHLHFQVKPFTVNPLTFIAGNNGYAECIDPMPYLDLNTPVVAPDPLVEFSHTWKVPKQRVKDFQSKHGLVPDGIVGKLTQAEIDKLI